MLAPTAALAAVPSTPPIAPVQSVGDPLTLGFGVLWTLFAGVFVVAGLYLVHRGVYVRAQRDRIASTEPTPAADVTPGAVEVHGTARVPEPDEALPDQTLAAPLSGRGAFAVSLQVEHYDTTGDDSSWVTSFTHDETVPFLVEDDSGEVLVDPPADAQLELEWTVEKASDFSDRAAPGAAVSGPNVAIQAFVERNGDPSVEIDDVERTGDQRYSEGLLEPGEEVYVRGAASGRTTDFGRANAAVDGATATGDFVVADRSEAELVRHMTRQTWGYLLGGSFVAATGVGFAAFFWLVVV